jgi:hypothetical protein
VPSKSPSGTPSSSIVSTKHHTNRGSILFSICGHGLSLQCRRAYHGSRRALYSGIAKCHGKPTTWFFLSRPVSVSMQGPLRPLFYTRSDI